MARLIIHLLKHRELATPALRAACNNRSTSIRPSIGSFAILRPRALQAHAATGACATRNTIGDVLEARRLRALGLRATVRRDRNHRHNVSGLEQSSSPNSPAATQALRRPGQEPDQDPEERRSHYSWPTLSRLGSFDDANGPARQESRLLMGCQNA
jgi:hypothetical protein